jgi:monoterpene epsilon-lactone hydrolase
MSSWQMKAMTAYFRLRRDLSGPPRQLDLLKDRADVEGLARFKALARAERRPVDTGGVAAEWLVPASARPGRTLLYLHGGGFCIGSVNSHRGLATSVAHAAHARVLLIDYRLAPEHPFPAGLEDCVAAYRWLLAGGIRPEQLAVVGDSAGGALTLSLLLAARDRGIPLPAAAVCLSPATDLTLSGESHTGNARSDIFLDGRHVEQWFAWYLDGHDPRDPLVSAVYADLRGLPPLLIQVGSAEIFLSDAIRFADRARAAGVSVTLEVLEHGQHIQHVAASLLPEGREAVTHIGEFIDQRLRG